MSVTMPCWRRLIRSLAGPALGWALLLVLALASGLTLAAGAPIPPLTDIRDETARLQEVGTELEAAVARRLLDAQRLEERLALDEVRLRARDVRPDLLRAARLELETARMRIDTLNEQTAHQRLALTQLEEGIVALAETPDPDPDTDLARPRRLAALRLLREQADTIRSLGDSMGRLGAAIGRLLTLDEQRLRLLQARVRLESIDDLAGPGAGSLALGADAQVKAQERAVTDALRAASRLSDEAAAVSGDDLDAIARRAALDARLQEVAVRGNLAQNDLELIGIRQRLDALAVLREDPSMPAGLLAGAADQVRALRTRLRGYQGTLQVQRQVLATRRTLAAGQAAPDGTAAPDTDLDAVLTRQTREVTDLLHRAGEERTRFNALAAQVYARSLTDRHPFPLTGPEWRRIAAGVGGLPRLLARGLARLAQDLRTRAAAMGPARGPLLLGGALLLVFGALVLSRALRRGLVTPDPTRRVAAPAAALAAALPLAIPAAVWTWVGTRLTLPGYEFVPVLLLVGILPVTVFVLTLARAALFDRDPAHAHSPARWQFYRRLRWGLLLSALVAALYLVTGSLGVSPLLGDVLDRLAMIGLLLLAVPAFGLRDLILHLAQRRRGTAATDGPVPGDAAGGQMRPVGRGTRLLSELSRLVALTLVAAGVLGLLGYANLAWAIASRLGWLALVGALLYFAIGTLGDLRDRTAGRLAGERGAFWRRYFLLPGHGLAVLLAWLAAALGLIRLWGWDNHTPPIRALLDWLAQPLVTAGHLSLTPWDLALSVLLVALAVATGPWVKQVSFQLAYGRVRDRGLRQALATLTQYVVMVCGVLLALEVSGLNLTTLLVFTASLGVGIGFGLQNIVNNFISGILLLVERPLRVGDVVTVGSHEGEVTRIGIRSLTVRTFDKQEVFIPNGTVISGDFINWTHGDDILRTVLTVGIGYQDDPDRAMTLIRDLLAGYEPVLRLPGPQVSLWEFGDSAVILRVEYCVHFLGPVGRTAVRSEVNRRIWYGFQTAGISIPFPQRDLHVIQETTSGNETMTG
ncbi:mechanosensitive ion channel domain-containing protein [Candidatus Thiodictyon syntrophicum]|jgi:potassium efflux system protein|uniref:Mechanosensitive ion channel protein MscS n=1 Tax=Candidatus Thiodictyon syntrophicum TaxID=1166950 RepID=A0A2K8U668_9GAMM|nr:mechanosensitive ion channel domain-containing protein [Candidatus Thiodictyon syntrophicum]AUB80521.1 hypothetical protein THSYN_05865 [Candidatus Thiodictyon syntrophicum]